MEINVFKNFEVEVKRLRIVSASIVDLDISPDNVDMIEANRKMVADFVKRIEIARKAVTSVFDSRKKDIMTAQKDFVNILAGNLDEVDIKLNSYYQNQLEINARDRKEAEKVYEEQTANVEDFESLIESDIQLNIKNATIDDKKRGFKETIEWAVSNKHLVPKEFFILDEQAINQAVRNGQEVPGIKVRMKAVRTGR